MVIYNTQQKEHLTSSTPLYVNPVRRQAKSTADRAEENACRRRKLRGSTWGTTSPASSALNGDSSPTARCQDKRTAKYYVPSNYMQNITVRIFSAIWTATRILFQTAER